MSLLFTTTAEGDARLVRKDKDCSKPGFSLTRAWPHIDPTYADALSVALDAVATYTDPKADNQSYTGTFVNSKVVCDEGDAETSERHVTILQTLILVSAPADTAALAALAGLITQGNLLKEPFGLKVPGNDGTIGEEDTISYRWHNIATSSRTTLMAITDANLVSGLPGAGWSYIQREFKEEDDNTATFTVVFQKIAWNTSFSASAPDLTWSDNYGTPHQRNNHLWLKVGNAVSYAAVYTPTSGYNVMRVDVTERRDGAVNIQRQEWKEAIGGSGTEIEEKVQRLVNPWAKANGTLYRITAVNHNITPKTDAYLTLSTSGASFLTAGYKQVETFNEVFNKDTGLWDSFAVWENTIWTGDVANNPDVVEWFDCGTTDTTNDEAGAKGSSRTGYRATWHGIPNASSATMVITVRDEAPKNTGFVTVEAGVRDNQNGSCTIWKVERRLVAGGTLPSADAAELTNTNPLGFENGALAYIRTIYDNYNYTTLGTATSGESAPSTYTLLNSVEDNHGNGLWSKTYTYIKATWSNSTSNPDFVLQGERNPTGFDIGRTDIATGIQNDATAVATFAAIAATSGYAIDDTRMVEKSNGELEFTKIQTLAKAKTDFVVVEFRPGYGGQEDTQRVWWPPMSAVDAGLVYTDAITNKAAMASATYSAAPTDHRLLSIRLIPNGNGLIAVERTTSLTDGLQFTADWDNYTVAITWVTMKFRRIWDTTTKAYVDQYRKYTWTDNIRQDSATAASAAYAYANGNSSGLKPVKSEVKFFGLGRYWAMYRTCLVGAWTPDPGGFADLGSGI
jgi:hypothetical protein